MDPHPTGERLHGADTARTARPAKKAPLPGELIYDIGMVLAVMLGLGLLATLMLDGFLPG